MHVAPPKRKLGLTGFGESGLNDERLESLLRAFCSDTPLPPVEVIELKSAEPYRYRVYDGTHRYRASIAAGFSRLPVRVIPDPQAFLDGETTAGAQTVRLECGERPAS